jgi:hypothetical protein
MASSNLAGIEQGHLWVLSLISLKAFSCSSPLLHTKGSCSPPFVASEGFAQEGVVRDTDLAEICSSQKLSDFPGRSQGLGWNIQPVSSQGWDCIAPGTGESWGVWLCFGKSGPFKLRLCILPHIKEKGGGVSLHTVLPSWSSHQVIYILEEYTAMLVSWEVFEVGCQGGSENSGHIFETLWQSSSG